MIVKLQERQEKPQNHLLAILPEGVYYQLEPHLKLAYLSQGEILHLAGETIEELYFPIDCMISITTTMNDGTTAETGLVGNRDVLGINAVMGDAEATQTEYIVQISGRALKIDAPIMRSLFQQNSALRDVMLRYTQALIAQISQTTACNRLHVLEERLARWLLESQDRVESNKLYLTQEFVSNMLGVRRAGVTQAAQKLQDRGIIKYSRGHIEILDLQGLRDCACECFRVVKDEYNRLLGT
ncbi:Crp/Fnr family transcriptional regulator [Myxosarcina sp. GI1(2024)]